MRIGRAYVECRESLLSLVIHEAKGNKKAATEPVKLSNEKVASQGRCLDGCNLTHRSWDMGSYLMRAAPNQLSMRWLCPSRKNFGKMLRAIAGYSSDT